MRIVNTYREFLIFITSSYLSNFFERFLKVSWKIPTSYMKRKVIFTETPLSSWKVPERILTQFLKSSKEASHHEFDPDIMYCREAFMEPFWILPFSNWYKSILKSCRKYFLKLFVIFQWRLLEDSHSLHEASRNFLKASWKVPRKFPKASRKVSAAVPAIFRGSFLSWIWPRH